MDDSWHYIKLRCSICGGRVRSYFGFNKCEECGHSYLTSYTHANNIITNDTALSYGKFEDLTDPYTVKIDCKQIRLFQKGLDIEFEIKPEKLENIDVIEINGHRFVKEK